MNGDYLDVIKTTEVKQLSTRDSKSAESCCIESIKKVLYSADCCLTILDGHIVIKNNNTGNIAQF